MCVCVCIMFTFSVFRVNTALVFSSACDYFSLNPTYICVSGLMRVKMKYQQTPQTLNDFLLVLTSWRQTMTEWFLFLVGRDRREITCSNDSQPETNHRRLLFCSVCFCIIQADRCICFSS